jgi:hypothetical protein
VHIDALPLTLKLLGIVPLEGKCCIYMCVDRIYTRYSSKHQYELPGFIDDVWTANHIEDRLDLP